MTSPVALATTVWGNGPRRVLLLHGLTSASPTWWRTGEALADRGYTVVAPDLRAHGHSPAGDVVSIEAHRDDVLLLGTGWDLLVGHSFGGAVAAAVVAANRSFADRLILEDPALDSATVAEWLNANPPAPTPPSYAMVAAENPDWDPRDIQIKVDALRACGPGIGPRTMADAAPWDLWGTLDELEPPTLVLAADLQEGSLISAAREEKLRAAGSRARVVRAQGAGHSIHREAFEWFLTKIEETMVV